MRTDTNDPMAKGEARLAWAFVLPALGVVLLIAIFPLGWTVWESLHRHDARMPWRDGFVGLGNYVEILNEPRFWAALWHTAVFTVGSVALELALGLVLALALNRAYRGRGLVRTAVVLPWAIPTVVAALLWGFMFDGRIGIVNATLTDVGLMPAGDPLVWFIRIPAAWVPIILADVWKMTPFVALLLLAGLQNIDGSLYEAAQVDGASAWRQFVHITLPLLKPAILVVLIFRTLDAFRVFDVIYVLTKGGPGTATEPVSLYTFNALLNYFRFGYGSALAVLTGLIAFLIAFCYIKLMGASLTGRVQ